MNKGFFNLIVSFSAFLLIAVLFSGCPSPASNSTAVGNASANKEQTPEKKAEPASSAADAGASQTRETLYDFRKVSDEKPPEFSKAETEAVLRYLLGDKWDPALAITARAAGAFTKPNARETLYFVTGCKDQAGKFVSNSTCGHVGWNTAGWIAVYDGTTPVLKIEEALGGDIRKITDVNRDGIDEILSTGGYVGMGIVTTGAGLGRISGGRYEEIKSFKVYAEDCGSSLSKDKKSVAAVLGYAPADGKTPEFFEEHFQTGCDDDGVKKDASWQKISKKEFDDFVDSIS